MTRRLSRQIAYLLMPEESTAGIRPRLPVNPGGSKKLTTISFKALFWAGMAVCTALMLGRLS